MDNHPIHKSIIIKEKLFERIKYLFGPPYIFPWNPIENYFSLLKPRYQKYIIKDKFDMI